MVRFLWRYKEQGWDVEGVMFSDGKVAVNEAGGVFAYTSFEEAQEHYPAAYFELTWLDPPRQEAD